MSYTITNDYFSFIWIIISYVMGSFPSGYILTKLSVKKNVLKIGWRKTSGSNVFKNIGIWQGILTGVLDVLKGYLAVYIAGYFGMPNQIQVLAGVAAVTGHNWSIFLNFAGGRGIGTLGGALLALSPQFFLWAVSILIVLALIWNAAIGTIVFLIFSIFLAKKLNQFDSIGMLVLISLIPIFVKRLSPINEIKTAQNKIALIKNRLVFDDDKSSGFRIKKIINKLTKKKDVIE